MINRTISRRLTISIIRDDINAYNGLTTIENYQPSRPEATNKALQQAYDKMIASQKALAEQEAHRKAAIDAARLAEWEFHNGVMAMKESVRGQFGSDSNEAQAIGLQKKSKYKRPTRTKQVAMQNSAS